LDDARRAAVRFASECLAFSNVPEPELIDQMSAATPGGISPVHPAWKRGVQRDAGTGWDFEDVRDHYLKLLYGLDPAAVRYASPERYFEFSRLVTGELMAEVFGEWRRGGSGCGGGILLQCGDLQPGAGWGIIDLTGQPKAAYWFLRRALAPVAIWTTNEGLNGVDIHVANDSSQPLRASLRAALYQHGERRVAECSREIEVGAGGSLTVGLEAMLGRFADAAYAYRFGPAGHDVVAASLHAPDEAIPFAQTFRFPEARPVQSSQLGLSGTCRALADGSLRLTVQASRLAWGVRVAARGFQPNDRYFGLEPGIAREIQLKPVAEAQRPTSVAVSAVNAESRLVVPVEVAA
jgi:beta-mannosidase